MSLPAEVTFATVVWKGLTAPDGTPYQGTVTFTPDVVDGLVAYPNAGTPFTITTNEPPYTVSLDSDGTLTADEVLASDNADLNPTAFTTTVSFDLVGLNIPTFHIAPLTPGETYNLTSLIPVDADGGIQGTVSTTGPAGPPTDFTIGTVTTGAAGTSAAATVSGTAPNLVLGFTIPRGDAGTPPAVGDIKMSGSATAQTGWQLCDGSSLIRTGANAALFAVIGTSYGNVDSTHFNAPNLSSVFPYGATPGATGGATTHTHSVPSLTTPNHSHTLSDAGQADLDMTGTNAVNARVITGVTAWTKNQKFAISYLSASGSETGGIGLNGSTDSGGASTTGTGTTGSGSSLPPYVGVAFFIKL